MLDYERLTKEVDLTKFDKVYLSFELGCRKPNKKIYDYVLQDLKCDVGDLLFIDDDTTSIAIDNKYLPSLWLWVRKDKGKYRKIFTEGWREWN